MRWQLVRDKAKRILSRVRSSRSTRTGLVIVFKQKVCAALRTPNACTPQLPRGLCGYVIVQTRTCSWCKRDELRTCDCSGGRRCVQ